MNIELDVSETHISMVMPKHIDKFARKLAFSKFVDRAEIRVGDAEIRAGDAKEADVEPKHNRTTWLCCSVTYDSLREFHRHVATKHKEDIQTATDDILQNGCRDARWRAIQGQSADESGGVVMDEVERLLPLHFQSSDEFPWLPLRLHANHDDTTMDHGQILLFYKYRKILNMKHVKSWQLELCQRLNLTGKIRLAKEGINATVGGSIHNTELFISAVRNHPLFSDMTDNDFKRSPGSALAFPDGLKIGIYQEIVPMGLDPEVISHENTGQHLSIDEFHEAASKYLSEFEERDNSLFVDCRNFYESKIGQFQGAVCPDIRKFSYWPEYVDKNLKLFENKKVYMYCTGGIRCERGSAYLINKGVCDSVYQLEGGIHKYIEKYPDGHFRGKLFVFDDRYHIAANGDIISSCRYCEKPWDQYEPCSSQHCHQLVLSCTDCRGLGLTACCKICQSQNNDRQKDGEINNRQKCGEIKEECECTKDRVRIPVENV